MPLFTKNEKFLEKLSRKLVEKLNGEKKIAIEAGIMVIPYAYAMLHSGLKFSGEFLMK